MNSALGGLLRTGRLDVICTAITAATMSSSTAPTAATRRAWGRTGRTAWLGTAGSDGVTVLRRWCATKASVRPTPASGKGS